MFLRTVLLLLTTLVVSAQEITILPNLRAGDQFRLEIVRVRETSTRPDSNARGVTPVDVTIVEASSDGYLLEWVPGESEVDNPAVRDNPILQAAQKALAGLRLAVILGPDGGYLGIQNETEVTQKLETMLEMILTGLESQIPDAEQLKMVQAAVRQVMSPSALLSSATQEITLYFDLNGIQIAPGETIEAQIYKPMPVVGGSLPATYRLTLDSVNETTAYLSSNMTFAEVDPLALAQQIAQATSVPIPEGEMEELPPWEMADEGTNSFDLALGLMREMRVTRRMAAGDLAHNLDEWEIRLVEEPNRE